MGPDTRRSLATSLVVLTAVLLAGATLAGYARRAFFDSDQFADRAASTLSDPSVRALVGDRVTDGVVLRHQEDLLSARPIIASTISEVVGAPAFRGLFRGAALDAHRAVFDRDQNTVTLTVADVGTVAATALAVLRPQPRTRSRTPAGSRSSIVISAPYRPTPRASRTMSASRPISWRR